jgi:O-antigen/teichoic acid export membrane protein
VAPVLQVMSFGLVLAGLENIGVVRFQKTMRFGLDFRFAFLKRITGFVITISAALLLQNYWAMVIGALAGRAFGVMLSYRMDDMRPGVSLASWRALLGFSQWMLVLNLGKHLNSNLHLFLVGRRADAATMGAYSLGNDISAMPSTELLAPVNRVLFPAFVQSAAVAGELKRLFLLAQGAQTLIAVPASVGLALVAHEAVLVLLGEKWLPAVPFVQVLALANVVHAITTAGGYLMLTLGRVREVALLEWVQVGFFALLALSAFQQLEPGLVAALRLVTVIAGLSAALWLLLRLLPELRFREVAATVARPLLAAGLMAGLLSLLGDMGGLQAAWLLPLKVSLGALIYVGSIALMWLAAGRPAGVESYLLDRFGISRKDQAPGAG